MRGKPASRAMEADAARDVRAAECRRSVAKRKLLPCDQTEDLAIVLTEKTERLAEHAIRGQHRKLACRFGGVLDATCRRSPAGCRTPFVRQRLPRDGVEPGERLVRDAVEPSP